MSKLIILSLVLSVILTACSSTPTQTLQLPENQSDQVLSRIDNLSARPSWLTESERFKIQDSKVIALGQTEIPATDRVDAAYRIAQSNARAEIAKAIEQKLGIVFQNAEEGTSVGANQVQYIATEASKLTTSSIRNSQVYWEKVSKYVDTSHREIRYLVYATATMPEVDFNKAVKEAIARSQGKTGISEDLAKKALKEWDSMVASDKH